MFGPVESNKGNINYSPWTHKGSLLVVYDTYLRCSLQLPVVRLSVCMRSAS